jgi:prophage tail gpP-like protein
MNAEGLESFGSSSSSSSSSLGPDTDTVDLLMRHNDDFINRVRETKKKEKAQREAKRQADRRAAKRQEKQKTIIAINE